MALDISNDPYAIDFPMKWAIFCGDGGFMKPHVIIFNIISLDGRIDFISGHVDMVT